MKYRVTIEGREREVDVRLSPSGNISVALDGAEVAADVRALPGGIQVRIGDRVHDVAVAGSGEDVQLAAGEARALAEVISERALAKRARSGGGAGDDLLRAPMPGRVVRVLCAAGDSVQKGQPIVVIEAMKMENELRASRDATIAAVMVGEGESVEAKATLVTFQSA